MKAKIDGELLDIREAARRLALKPATLRSWVLRQRIGCCRPGGRAVRIPAAEVERIIAESYVPAREVQR
jgi:excisionase family DNA binding protein